MHRKLTVKQIRDVCVELLEQDEAASIRDVRTRLKHLYDASGRTKRVAGILRSIRDQQRRQQPVDEMTDLATLRRQLIEAEERAARAEEMERRHQDFWAARYQEKVEELEARMAAQVAVSGVSPEQYLRLYQRAMELARRLAQYEEVGPLLPPR